MHHFLLQLLSVGNQVAIYGDKGASEAFLEYYYALVSQSQGERSPLSTTEHHEHQTKIIVTVHLPLS